MMGKTLFPVKLRGNVCAPVSKSELHRALICASLSEGETTILCPNPAEDTLATADSLRALGAEIRYNEGRFFIHQIEKANSTAVLDCGESGSTLRFLLPLAAALGVEAQFLCRGRLADRPVQPLLDVLNHNGCTVERRGKIYLLRGKLQPESYVLDASESSQYLSGLLMVLPLLPGSSICRCGQMVSENYVNFTCDVMKHFGVNVDCAGGVYSVRGGYFGAGEYVPEGDWSGAAYWLTSNALGGEISVDGLSKDSVQGDRAVVPLIAAICRGGAVVNVENVPDLLPPLAVLAAVTPGETHFTHAARLRQKESNRLTAVTAMLKALGGDCAETADGLFIRGVSSLRGGAADARGDHRIAMAAAIAAAVCETRVTLRGAETVVKSYPAFWSDFERLGGIVR